MPEGAHCYCAICGGPLNDQPSNPTENPHHHLAGLVSPYERNRWTSRVYVLGWGGLRHLPTQAYLSAAGEYDGNNGWYGQLFSGTINPDGHRRIQYEDIYPLYRDVASSKPAFPIHGPCYNILHHTILGVDGHVTQEHLNALHATMENMTAYSAAHLAVDYGFVGEAPWKSEDPRHSYWINRLSQKWLLEDPSADVTVENYCRALLLSPSFGQQMPFRDLRPKVVIDPFLKAPLEIMNLVFRYVDLADILNLSKASWAVHIKIRDDQVLWKKVLATSVLPFFYELNDIEEKEKMLRHHNARDICRWVHHNTAPERGRETRLPGVANRRRIWKVCLQLKDMYHRYLAAALLQDHTRLLPPDFRSGNPSYGYQYQVAWPLPQSADNPHRAAYWELLPWWKDLAYGSHMITADWHLDGTLARISIGPSPSAPEGQLNAQPDAAEISQGDRIRELILHIPDFDNSRRNASFYPLLPRGITVVLSSGTEIMFGETGNGHNMRPLVASRENATILGLWCQIGLVYGHERVIYHKIVEALPSSDVVDTTEKPAQDAQSEPRSRFATLGADRLARYLWKTDYRELFGGTRIWNVPGLHLSHARKVVLPCEKNWESKSNNAQPIAFEAMVWATSPGDFRRVKRLSAWMPHGLRPLALRLEMAGDDGAGTAETQQIIGAPHDSTGWRYKIDLDGAGGEFITEIAIRNVSLLKGNQDFETIRVSLIIP
ncbi:hypothetical protein PG991_000728 [Apiospora marii]|uniref:F-box domain-containing protein n=1 Tax=Apiospora marii TaxID=335849 RepID=A0ABR1SST5_9PEZI